MPGESKLEASSAPLPGLLVEAGGGKPELAQGGGPNAEKLYEALAAGREAMRARA